VIPGLRMAVGLSLAALLSPAVAEARITAFKSPSGNITCVISTGGGQPTFAQCEVRSRGVGYHLPRRGRVNTYDGRGHDDLAHRRFVLDYGRSVRRGVFRCRSRESGMTCRSLVSGHGFTVSREGARLF
jgi:hypothetical protein